MNSQVTFTMDVGYGVIRSYKRLSYKVWYALAEFIDNSVQSFLNNRDVLEGIGAKYLEVKVKYEKDFMIVEDTAMGMDESELRHALRLGEPPTNPRGRSEYGLGMKTSACWFGDVWTVTTKKYGEEYEYEVVVDVEEVAKGNAVLPTTSKLVDKNAHYTKIKIEKLHRKPHGQTKARIEMYIRSMYRIDLKNADLWITINDSEPIEPDADNIFLEVNNEKYRKEFSTEINGKSVFGWLGILNPGARSKAGIAIVRRGRVIKGQPDAWRPEKIFGEDAPNNLLNQRLVGEINLNEFSISHTKDEILWVEDEEIQIQDYLHNYFAEYIKIAGKTRKGTSDTSSGPSEAEIELGLSELRAEMESPSFAEAIEMQEVPPDDIVKNSGAPLIDSVKTDDPDMKIQIGENTVRLYLNKDASPNDPYFTSDFPGTDVIVAINTKHKHFMRVGGAEGVKTFLMDCVYDALAECKALRKNIVKHDTIKYLKDGLLRLDITES